MRCRQLDPRAKHCNKSARFRHAIQRWGALCRASPTCSPASPFRRAIPTRSAIAFPDEVVDLFFREGPKAGIDPWQLRVACETLATTNQVVIAGETRAARDHHQGLDLARRAHGHQGHRLRAGWLPLGEGRHRGAAASAVGRHRPGRRQRPATRTRARATRASCSATPARDTPELMPAPIYYSHKILTPALRGAPLGQGSRARPRRQEPGDRALRERQAGRRHPDRRLARSICVESMTSAQVREHRRALRASRRCRSGWIGKDTDLARQPDRHVRHRRP